MKIAGKQVNKLVCNQQYLLSKLQPDQFLGPLLAAVVRTHQQSLRWVSV